MRYGATVRITDCMDQVVVQVTAQAWDGIRTAPEDIAEFTYSWPGVGELDPAKWLSAALTRTARSL